MKSSDIARALFIFIIFGGLLLYSTLAQGAAQVRKNWPKYRCNPAVMPFAGTFGYDSKQNFADCIGDIQKNMMGFLTMPMSFNLDALGDLGGGLTDAVGSIRGAISNLRSQITAVIGSVMAVFLNLMVQIQQMFILLKDMIGKFVGILATIMHLLSTMVTLGDAIWKGTPGKIARALCFHPDTLVCLSSGEMTKMCEVQAGDVLKGGGRVCATMGISNLDENGRPVECLYNLSGGEDGESVRVSGSHLVYDKRLEKFLPVRHLPVEAGATLSNEVCDTFSCLITSDHLIPIGTWLFHDWEDNVGSKSKSLA